MEWNRGGCESDQDAIDAIASLDSLEGLPATTVVLCMEGRAAWRVLLAIAGKDRRVSVQMPWGGDLYVLESQQQKRAADCDASRGFGKVIGFCKTDLVLYTRREEGRSKGSCDNPE